MEKENINFIIKYYDEREKKLNINHFRFFLFIN